MELNKFQSINELKLRHQVGIQNSKVNSNTTQAKTDSFSEVLRKSMENDGVQFSKHALARMNERGVNFTEDLISDLNGAIEKAREKGAKDVVIIGAESAFIVNIPNNVVITTMNSGEMRNNIFTNIDSAVLI